MKNTMRKAMLSTIAMLVVAVMSLTGVTYAWFSASTTANVQGMTVNVAAADGGFQLSTDHENWKSNLVLTDASAELNPVSTADAVSFFTAVVDPDDEKMITTTLDSTKTNVFSKTIYAKNTGETDIVVSLSNILTGEGANPVFVNSTANKNSAAAARVAVFVDGALAYIFGDEATKGVKAAAEFDCTATNDTTNMADQGTKTAVAECTFVLEGQEAGRTEDTYSTIQILVWIEGQDSECVNANAASTFTVELDFTAAQKAN